MIGQRSQLINFVSKFMGTVRFGNDHVAAIMGYEHYQKCHDFSGIDLLKRSRGTNLHTLSLEEMMQSSLICLLPKASKTKSWLWHQRKKKKHTYKPKSEDSIQEKLYLLHMDHCGPMRIESINGKTYIFVIVNDYSRFTWVKYLHSKDETPEFVIKFLNQIQVRLNAIVRNIRTDNEIEFVNQTQNQTLVEAALTMLILSKAPLYLWAEAEATTCFTQNQSLIRKCHNKTPYELLHDKKPDLTYFHVFCVLFYLTNDSEDLGKLKPEFDIGIFIGYSLAKKAYQIYNKRTCLIMETIHVEFDKLTVMAFEKFGSGLELQLMTPETISLGLAQNPSPSAPYVPPKKKYWDILFQPMFHEYF
ncbi:retrovirus-related pol polyprotein from transposon TNT 1-94 [Tanacetum coccineum]